MHPPEKAWLAHVSLTIGWKGPVRAPETWKVCESCANLMIRDRAPDQEVISKKLLPKPKPKKKPRWVDKETWIKQKKDRWVREKKKAARKKREERNKNRPNFRKVRSKVSQKSRGGLTKKERVAKARKAFLERTAKKD